MTHIILTRKDWEGDSIVGVAKASKVGIVPLRTGDPFPDDVQTCIRWGCTATVNTKNTINKSKAIHLAHNKTEMRKLLQAEKLCPETWFHSIDLLTALVDGDTPHGTWVVRPANHSRGKDMLQVSTAKEIVAADTKFGEGSYITRLVDKQAEFRVVIVQGRVIQVINKVPSDYTKLNWGMGSFKNVLWGQWPLDAVVMALKAYKLSGLNFGAVDVVLGSDSTFYVLEINTAPEVVGGYGQGLFAKAFDTILTTGNKDDIPIISEATKWQHYIHPSISKEAI